MEQINRTVRIKLLPEDNNLLPQTMEAYTDACNWICDIAWNKKLTNKVTLHHEVYYKTRELFNLSANLACSSRDKVAEAVKATLKRKGSKPHFNFTPIRYDARTCTIKPSYCTLSTNGHRVKCNFILGKYQRNYLEDKSWEFGSADLVYRNKTFYLHLTLHKLVSSPNPPKQVIGVDLGVKNIAVTSTNKFFKAGKLNWRRNHYFRVRKSLQSKGTRGAKRVLQRLSGRENRFHRDALHCISKWLVSHAATYDSPIIVFEKLTNIRRGAKFGRKGNRQIHSWGFATLQNFVEYKALAQGIPVDYVDARYTSQKCSKCGYIAKANRNGSIFKCRHCGFQLHSDLNASRSIALNFTQGYSPEVRLPANQPLSPTPRSRDKLTALAVSS